MKFMFVVGGTYKAFYLNQLNKIKKIDLLVFNQGIFYTIETKTNKIQNSIVGKELIELNKKLNCPIIVHSKLFNNGEFKDCFILCKKQKVCVIKRQYMYLYIKGELIIISNKIYNKIKTYAQIIFNRQIDCLNNMSLYLNNCFLCGNRYVKRINKGKINTKFKKCCKFALRF